VDQHHDIVEGTGAAQCQACHGLDYRGTVLSRSQANQTLTAFGSKNIWRGFQIGCYTCHNGPGSESANPNRPAVVSNATASTSTNTPVAIPLNASDPNGNPLTLRIVSQTRHGSVGLVGTAATYYPETDYVGGDSFTFAAWDGQTDSNLGTVQITVGAGGCTYVIAPTTANPSAFSGVGSVNVTAGSSCPWTATSGVPWITVTAGASGSGNGVVKYSVTANGSTSSRMGTLNIAGFTFTITQAASSIDLQGAWGSLAQTCRSTGTAMRCSLKGQFNVLNASPVNIPSSTVAFYMSNDGTLHGSSTLLKQYRIKRLRPNQAFTRTLSLKLPKGTSLSGLYVVALADADDALPDVDDSNNILPYGPLP
jgi:hypothetical protein